MFTVHVVVRFYIKRQVYTPVSKLAKSLPMLKWELFIPTHISAVICLKHQNVFCAVNILTCG